MFALSILKPDAVAMNITGAIIGPLEASAFKIVHMERKILSRPVVRALYKQHTDKDFWQRIEDFMVEGPSHILVWEVGSRAREFREDCLRIRTTLTAHWNTSNKASNFIHSSEPGDAVYEIGLVAPGFDWP
jgi:nucleoside diphosphate kinase